jgi:hypothetical protein
MLGECKFKGVSLAKSIGAQQCVHPTSGSRRVFEAFAWLEVDSGKMVLSQPAQPPGNAKPLARS